MELFISATDTDAGKTLVACAITASFVSAGKRVAVFKPLSAGCELIDNHLVNEDAKLLQGFANCQQSIEQINPIAFIEPIAPHIAAAQENKTITSQLIANDYAKIKALNSDVIITEGAGGWRLPLGNGEYLSDFVKGESCGVILVVGMKLGCLNHAMLTYEAIIEDGLQVVGWVANHPQAMPYLEENIELLSSAIKAPLLGRLAHMDSVEQAARCLDLSLINV
ncbi:dethiobiotin synthase [Thalassotalea sp. ND16A]|uniref:dethiobiotin synthase n=1 Tax=Thalassotalea sp. ND16A TaxID=1535422 RepID=UPI00051D7DB0|nr:dethiobiotin synthase [Thalassotalea sp. ND16A]KGJ96493.1 hypothetical protein ND16A_1075 [Thalassotalea sp. ND16A]